MHPLLINAVIVNHNTSAFTELALRSLLARHRADLPLRLTVLDNASEDDTAPLRACAAAYGVPVVQTGFDTHTANNSHGEVLTRFVRDNPHCSHYLLLDTDICFMEDDTVDTMLQELDAAKDAFAVCARFSWDGATEISVEEQQKNPDLYETRMHPGCALIRNTPLFRRVVDAVGMSAIYYMWPHGGEYLDTCKLMTRVMGTHGLRHVLSERMVLHFFSVSYEWDHEALRLEKARRCEALLEELRAGAGREQQRLAV